MDIEKKYMNLLINNNSYNSTAILQWRNYFSDYLNSIEIKDSKQIEIFLYIVENINLDTSLFIGTYKKISEDVKCSQTTIAKIMKKLQSSGFLRKLQNGVWFVDTNVFYECSQKTEEEKINSLIKQKDDEEAQASETLNILPFSSSSSKTEDPNFVKTKVTNNIIILNRNLDCDSLHNLVMDELFYPYLDLKTQDFSLKQNDSSENDYYEYELLNKIKANKICVSYSYSKQDTKTSDFKTKNVEEFIQGTSFITPITTQNFLSLFRNWAKPITVARQLNGKMTESIEVKPQKPGVAEIVYTNNDESKDVYFVNEFSTPGIITCNYNLAGNIISFARNCFEYALKTKTNLLFTDRIDKSTIFDRAYYDTFTELFERDYKEKFKEEGIKFNHGLTDSTIGNAINSQGGFIWAINNHDGELINSMVTSAFGGSGLMKTVIVSNDESYIFKAKDILVEAEEEGKKLVKSDSAIALIYAWTSALRLRGEVDGLLELIRFSNNLEQAVLNTIGNGYMTRDLAKYTNISEPYVLGTKDFILAIKKYFEDIYFAVKK